MEESQIVIEARIMHDAEFCVLCLKKLYEAQTDDEQKAGITQHGNGIGFTRSDAPFLTICVNYINKGYTLQPPTFGKLQYAMKKYSRQLTTLLTVKEIES